MSKTEINKLKHFIKRPKDNREVLEDIADFAIISGLLKLVSDRVSLWKREKAVGVFLTSCNSTINHIDGLNTILEHYLNSMIHGENRETFNELQSQIEGQLLTYFTNTSATILEHIEEKAEIV